VLSVFVLYLYITLRRCWWTGNRKCSRGKQVSNVHEFATYSTIHIRHNVLISGKLRHPASLLSWWCRMSQLR
jgi:hypothetical protein